MMNYPLRLKYFTLILSAGLITVVLSTGCIKTVGELAPVTSDTLRHTTPPQDTVPDPAKGSVSTFAGSGELAEADGTGLNAGFHQPYGIAIDSKGNLYVVDQIANAIRKVTPAGVVTTIAGGAYGENDGPALQATFSDPSGIAVDAAGNLYIADAEGSNITRKITPDGNVSTFCAAPPPSGGGSSGNLYGIAVDVKGNIYQSDVYNNQVRKITPAGVSSIFAGSGVAGSADGPGTAATFNNPNGLACDVAGNVYVADFYNRSVRKITPQGVVTTIAGVNTHPTGIVVSPTGDLYTSDGFMIEKITTGGKVTIVAGTGVPGYQDGQLDQAQFNYGYGITMDASGNIFMADELNNRIRKLTLK